MPRFPGHSRRHELRLRSSLKDANTNANDVGRISCTDNPPHLCNKRINLSDGHSSNIIHGKHCKCGIFTNQQLILNPAYEHSYELNGDDILRNKAYNTILELDVSNGSRSDFDVSMIYLECQSVNSLSSKEACIVQSIRNGDKECTRSQKDLENYDIYALFNDQKLQENLIQCEGFPGTSTYFKPNLDRNQGYFTDGINACSIEKKDGVDPGKKRIGDEIKKNKYTCTSTHFKNKSVSKLDNNRLCTCQMHKKVSELNQSHVISKALNQVTDKIIDPLDKHLTNVFPPIIQESHNNPCAHRYDLEPQYQLSAITLARAKCRFSRKKRRCSLESFSGDIYSPPSSKRSSSLSGLPINLIGNSLKGIPESHVWPEKRLDRCFKCCLYEARDKNLHQCT